MVVITPTIKVTNHRGHPGVTTCKAKPARYSVGFAVVQPAITTVNAPIAPRQV